MRAGPILAGVLFFLGGGGGCLADDNADAEVVALVAVAHLLSVGRSAILGVETQEPPRMTASSVHSATLPSSVVEAPWIRLQGSHGSEFGMAVG